MSDVKQVDLLDNFDLTLLCQKIKMPLTQICRIEDLKVKPNKNKENLYIINYNNTHWVCFYISKNNHGIYYDSYGEPPKNDIIRFFTKYKVKYSINYQQTQHLDSTACGWYCLTFLHYLYSNRNNKNFVYVVSQFNEKFNSDNQTKNDETLQKYVKQIFSK